MKKVVALVVLLLVAVGWFAARWRGVPVVDSAATQRPAVVASATPAKPTAPARVEAAPTPRSVAPAVEPVVPVAPAPGRMAVNDRGVVSAAIPMSLTEVLRPGNVFLDAKYGVTAVYPEGWTVAGAIRWGEDQRENTVHFTPPEGSQAAPSMYYQEYREAPPSRETAEATLREMAQKKEEARSNNGTNDYKNDPGSFVFREVDGHPTLSYFATFRGGTRCTPNISPGSSARKAM